MKIKAIVFDWAGTTVDFGCFAPINAFMDAFSTIGIVPTMEETRKPMGMLKIEHIRTMLNMERINKLFQEKSGRNFTNDDVEKLYEEFKTSLFKNLDRYAEPIENVVDIVNGLREKGYKIGSTTGYTSKMMEVVTKNAKELGYYADHVSTATITGVSRPKPDMVFNNMEVLGISNSKEIIKVGDTISDIKEGVNAKAWSVGVLKGSSQMGLTVDEYNAMTDDSLLKKAEQEYFEAGADYVLNSITELPKLIETINERMVNDNE